MLVVSVLSAIIVILERVELKVSFSVCKGRNTLRRPEDGRVVIHRVCDPNIPNGI